MWEHSLRLQLNNKTSKLTNNGISSLTTMPGKSSFSPNLVYPQFKPSTNTQLRSSMIWLMSPCLPLSRPFKICTRSPRKKLHVSIRKHEEILMIFYFQLAATEWIVLKWFEHSCKSRFVSYLLVRQKLSVHSFLVHYRNRIVVSTVDVCWIEIEFFLTFSVSNVDCSVVFDIQSICGESITALSNWTFFENIELNERN